MATIVQLIRERDLRVVDRAAVVFRDLGAGSGGISRRWVALTEISGGGGYDAEDQGFATG